MPQFNRSKITSAISLVFGGTDLIQSQALPVEGQLMHLHVRVPNFANVVTATVTLENDAGYVLWSSATDYGALAKNANYNLLLEELIPGNALLSLKVTLSGVSGGGGTVTIVGRYFGFGG